MLGEPLELGTPSVVGVRMAGALRERVTASDLVLTLTFIVIQFVPGGPVEQILAEARAGTGGDTGGFSGKRDLDKKQIEDLKKLYGFDKPPLERYVSMMKSFAQFDLGKSFLRNKDVWQLIKDKMPVSISLGLWTFLVSYLISVPLGIAKAVREGTRFDAATTLLVLVGYAIPGFVLVDYPDRSGDVEADLHARSEEADSYRRHRTLGRSQDPTLQRIYEQSRAAWEAGHVSSPG